MNLVVYSGYWHNYSRLLFNQDGIKIEVSMTPPPPTTRGWDNIAEQRVRVHTTSSKGDKTMGIDFMPESAVTLMRGYLGWELTTRICEFDYLGEMMRIFNTQDVDILRDYLRMLPCNGGIKWEDICLAGTETTDTMTEKWLYDRWNSPVVRGNIVIKSDITVAIRLYNENPYHDLFFTKEENGEISLSRYGMIIALMFAGY